MSQLEVDKIIPQSGTTLTIGDSGDTVNFADGTNLSIDTNTLYIDSTNNRVGIANSSPSTTLDVSGDATIAGNINLGDNNKLILGTGNDLEIFHNGTNSYISDNGTGDLYIRGSADIRFTNPSATENYAIFNDNGAVDLYYDNAKKFETTSTGALVTGRLSTSAGNASEPNFNFSADGNTGIFRASEDVIAFSNNGSESMRIDSSGNTMVGTTESLPGVGNTTLGVSLRNNGGGSIAVSRGGDRAGYFNRNTSDGDIIQFRKDGTEVGTIGTGGGYLHIGKGDTGIAFASDDIIPYNTDTPATRDNGIDLGGSGYRFKDLYLGGGLYVGGTGSANYLDDYEEGTWTPSASVGTVSHVAGGYIKIGRLVTLTIDLLNFSESSSTANIQINGIPFAVDSSENMATGAMFGERIDTNNNGNSVQAVLTTSSSGILFFNGIGSTNFAQLQYADINDGGDCAIRGTITYLASS